MQSDSNHKTVLISAGEASGDAHAARMVDELKKLDPGIQFTGMGGDKMRQAGVDILVDISKMAVVGLVEVLIKYRSLKAELVRLQKYIDTHSPDLVILVDYQEFNQQLSAYAKQRGVKTLFYIGPQVWAWRAKRVYKMAKIVDHLAVILPFEVDCYKDTDLAVTFTGHPLTDEVVADKTPTEARNLLGLDDKITIGLFPGSRSGEIKRVLPVMLDAAEIIAADRLRAGQPAAQFVLPVATTVKSEHFLPFKTRIDKLNVQLINDRFYDTSMACDVILTSSGTSALEIGLLNIPMVIVYRISPLSHFILSYLVSVKYLGLMNIMANREIVKEFIQNNARAAPVAEEALRLLNDDCYNRKMRQELSMIREQLGKGGGSKNIAALAHRMLNNKD